MMKKFNKILFLNRQDLKFGFQHEDIMELELSDFHNLPTAPTGIDYIVFLEHHKYRILFKRINPATNETVYIKQNIRDFIKSLGENEKRIKLEEQVKSLDKDQVLAKADDIMRGLKREKE